MRRDVVLAASLILVALVHFALQLTWRFREALTSDGLATTAEPACRAQVLVVVPLEDARLELAETALRSLFGAWRAAAPCSASSSRGGTSLLLAWLGSDAQAASLHRLAGAELARIPHCFARVEVLGRESLQRHTLPRRGRTGWSAGTAWEPAARWRNVSALGATDRTNALFLSAVRGLLTLDTDRPWP